MKYFLFITLYLTTGYFSQGQNWRELPPAPNQHCCIDSSKSVHYKLASDTLLVSFDYAQSWTPALAYPGGILHLYNDSTLFNYSYPKTLSISYDFGETWSISKESTSFKFRIKNGDAYLIESTTDSKIRLSIFQPTTRTFKELGVSNEIFDFASTNFYVISNEKILLWNYNEIFLSKDSGRTFEKTHSIPEDKIGNQLFYAKCLFSNKSDGILASYDGYTLKTTNGGKTWYQLKNGVGTVGIYNPKNITLHNGSFYLLTRSILPLNPGPRTAYYSVDIISYVQGDSLLLDTIFGDLQNDINFSQFLSKDNTLFAGNNNVMYYKGNQKLASYSKPNIIKTIQIHPNPSHSSFNIGLKLEENSVISCRNALGETIPFEINKSTGIMKILVEGKGMIFIELKTASGQTYRGKAIKL